MTRLTQHHVLYQSKTSSIVTSWSCHHCAISHHHHVLWWWIMRSNRHWIDPSLSPGVCQVSITLFWSCDPFFIMLYHPFSHDMSYAPVFTHHWILDFLMTHFPFVLADSFVLTTHFISNQPTNHGLAAVLFSKAVNFMGLFYQPTPTKTIWPLPCSLMPLFLYCCDIYRSHICGVLSWPHFCIYTALGRCGRLSLAL